MGVAAACCVGGSAWAQDGTVTGSSTIFDNISASVVVTEQYNDNIFSTRNGLVGDFITEISPKIGFHIVNGQLTTDFGASADLGFHADHPSEDYEDFEFYGEGRYRVSPDLLLFSGASYRQEHESRGSPDDVNGTEPTTYSVLRAFGVAAQRFEAINVKVGTTYDYYDFDDVSAAAGTINNDDRDRHMLTAGVRVDRSLDQERTVFGEFTYDWRDYRAAVDDFGQDRDSQGVRLTGGLRQRLGTWLDLEAYGGWLYQDFDQGSFGQVSTFDAGGRLLVRPTTDTTLRVRFSRSLEETTLSDASSYVQSAGSVGVVTWPRPDVRFDASLAYYVNDYQDANRTDHLIYASLGARYYVTPNVYVGADYEFENRDSNNILQNYEQSRLMLRLGANVRDAFDENALEGDGVAPIDEAGFYIGGQSGLVTTGTDLAGPRGAAGTLQSDFANYAFAGGVFGGFGFDVDLWRVAVEGDVSFASGGWDHARLPGGRVFSVDREEAYGGSALLGRHLPGGNLLYGRAGLVLADFETYYRTPGGATTNDDSTELGFRLGVGGAVPLSPELSLRMEYGYTAFDDYNISPSPGGGAGTDNFRNAESGMQIGLAYNFLPASVANERLPTIMPDYQGPYVGLQIGHGSLVSELMGPRQAGSTLSADFGDVGATGGAFAGYDIRFGQFVFSPEVDIEISDAAWDHDRTNVPPAAGDARDFSIDKQFSIGAGFRVGFVLDNGALLYARGGIVGSEFRLKYRQPGGSNTDDEFIGGWRVGVGMQLPITEALAVRLDFTHTDYEDTRISQPLGGVDTHQNSETLFRLGTVFGF